jgi:hypothetical protein
MKNLKNAIIGFFLTMGLFLAATNADAQTEAPPPPGHGTTSQTVPGGGAPVGEGLIFLLAMGAAYATKKMYKSRKKLAE